MDMINKNIAIKGHSTRGKEVIEILEMLGGNNPDKLIANFDYLGYFIGSETRNIYHFHLQGFDSKNVIIFTLEEFLEKFPYKVGYKVQHKGATSCGSVYEVEKMRWVDDHVEYEVKRLWCWNDHYTFTAEDLQPYIEETMDKAVFDANAQCCDIMNHLIKEETMEEKLCIGLFPVSNGRKEIIPCDGYEVVSDEGKFYVVKKPPQYPKTYDECVNMFNRSVETVNLTTIAALRELIYCRNAYWKIAGEQMRLGKPWEYDMSKNEFVYTIAYQYGFIQKCESRYKSHLLVFPTKEMRDEFYENFKDLIEQCKELL